MLIIKVGVLLHETTLLSNETYQSVREIQLIEFNSHGHYDLQSVYVMINTSQVNDSIPPLFELSWGSRSVNISFSELLTNKSLYCTIYYAS